jgi:1-acyl-sn-glycerol-3-phosphate acyltransferase
MQSGFWSKRDRLGLIRQPAERLWYAWRVMVTAFSFALFGILSVGLGLVILPLMALLPGEARVREFRAQSFIRGMTRFYLFVIQALGTCTIGYQGSEKLREPGILVIANHPTLLDALALIAQMPQADCVVKEGFFRNRLLGLAAKGAGYIPSGHGPAMVKICAERLRAGRSVIIFPEGTRSPADELGAFTRGAAHIALRANKCPIPVTIYCNPPTLHHGQKWWQVPEQRFSLALAVGEPLAITDFTQERASRGQAARSLTELWHSYFERQVTVV